MLSQASIVAARCCHSVPKIILRSPLLTVTIRCYGEAAARRRRDKRESWDSDNLSEAEKVINFHDGGFFLNANLMCCSRLHSSYDVARRTVLLMREICSKTRWANARWDMYNLLGNRSIRSRMFLLLFCFFFCFCFLFV